jgi:hypothetical protein
MNIPRKRSRPPGACSEPVIARFFQGYGGFSP